MDLSNALKAGIVPYNSTPVEIILTAEKEGLSDMLKKQRKIHHNILKNCTSVDEAREHFSINGDFNGNEVLEMYTDLTFWKPKCERLEPSILKTLRRSKLYEPISNNLTNICYKCEVSVTSGYNFFQGNRIHHCRSCGRIFCGNCTKWLEIVPEDLVDYIKKDSWVQSGSSSRVCEKCKDIITVYRKIEPIVKYFEIVAYPIDLCIRASTLCKDWREAMRYYLSNIRNIQYYLPNAKLESRDIRALESNRKFFQGHSRWMLQLLKIRLISPDVIRKTDCCDVMCDKYCTRELTPYDSVIILNSNMYNPEVKLMALKNLSDGEHIKHLAMFLPIEDSSIQEYILKCPQLFTDIFLASRMNNSTNFDIFRNKLILANGYEASEIQECIRLISILDSKTTNLCELSKELHALTFPFTGPFGQIHRFDHEITMKHSKTKPVIIKYYDALGEQKSFLYKKEDIRKDSYIVSLVRIMHDLCSDIVDRPLAIYRVVPTSKDSGFIEIIQKALTIDEILKKGSISNYLNNKNKDKIIGDIASNYFVSLAFWTVTTYILGVGDRHNENIMIREDGNLFHIDYGFVFGSYSNGSPVKIDKNLIEGLGGVDMYEPFKKLCCDIFICLRNNCNLILSCLSRLSYIDQTDQSKNMSVSFIEDFILGKLLFGQTDDEACKSFSNIIDSSRDNIFGYVSDTIHSTVTKVKFSLWSTN